MTAQEALLKSTEQKEMPVNELKNKINEATSKGEVSLFMRIAKLPLIDEWLKENCYQIIFNEGSLLFKISWQPLPTAP